MVLRTNISSVHEVEVVVTISVTVIFFYLRTGTWCARCVVHGMSLWWRSRSRRLPPHKAEDSRPKIDI